MSSPPLNKPCNRAGLFKRPVRSSASSCWPQALVQNRKQLLVGSFVLAVWPSCRGPRQPAANELGGGPVRHVRPTELERLAGPSAPCSATPHAEFDLTPRTVQRAEKHWSARPSRWTSPARGKGRCLHYQNWLQVPDRSRGGAGRSVSLPIMTMVNSKSSSIQIFHGESGATCHAAKQPWIRHHPPRRCIRRS